jgi:hypothetical protein
MKLQSCARTLSLPLVGVALFRLVIFTLGRYRGRPTLGNSNRLFSSVDEHQASLGLDAGYQPAPVVVPALRDEIAAAWGYPLGQRVEICFRGGQRSAISGRLELLRAPDYPWDPRQPLQLAIAGFVFSSREIGQWTIL